MKTGRGKVVAITSGVIVAGILLAMVAYWKDFAVLHYLRRLGSDPDYLFEIVDRPEGSAARLAVNSFTRSDQGAKLVLRTLLAQFERSEKHRSPGLTEVEIGILGFGDPTKLKTGRLPGLWYYFTFKDSSRRGVGRLQPSLRNELYETMHPTMLTLLPKVPGQEWILPECPGFRFSVLTADAAFDRLREAASRTLPGTGHPAKDFEPDFEKFPLVILVQRVDL